MKSADEWRNKRKEKEEGREGGSDLVVGRDNFITSGNNGEHKSPDEWMERHRKTNQVSLRTDWK